MEETLTVRLTPYRPGLGTIMHRQTRGQALTSLDGRYRFYIGDEGPDDPDFWVVQSKGLRQTKTLHVARQNTILLSTEPRSVLTYPKDYMRQFGLVATCQPQVKHPHTVLLPPVLPWFVGYEAPRQRAAAGGKDVTNGQKGYTFSQDYDSLALSGLPEKTKLLAVITSDKAFTRGHVDRIRFVRRLKEHFGERLDVFGEGIRPFGDKWDVTAPYRYQIVIENSREPYYWTEKLGDCYLCGTFPFYYGCTNVDDYFPQGACEPIDIQRPEEAIRVIEREVEADRWTAARDVLTECKRRVLDEYNMFEVIARLCDMLDASAQKEDCTLHPCRSMHDWHNAWNYLVGRHYYEMLNRMKGGRL